MGQTIEETSNWKYVMSDNAKLKAPLQCNINYTTSNFAITQVMARNLQKFSTIKKNLIDAILNYKENVLYVAKKCSED